MAADFLHVLAAGGWIGALFILLTAGIPATKRAGDERWNEVALLVNAFSPAALACAALLTLTGAWATWMHAGSISALFTTAWGRTLLIKLALLAAVLAAGAWNWLRLRPALGSEAATLRLRASARTELTLGIVLLLVTAILVATPPPSEAADAADPVHTPVP
jgi:putative copper resistance protein D